MSERTKLTEHLRSRVDLALQRIGLWRAADARKLVQVWIDRWQETAIKLAAETQRAEQFRSLHESAQAELRQWTFHAPNANAAEQMVLHANGDAARTADALDQLSVDHAALRGVLALTQRERDGLAAEVVRLGRELELARKGLEAAQERIASGVPVGDDEDGEVAA